jgi:bisphosphoglycerate-independent phosphoglycerate mutase (AlkP superfamily)
MKRSHQRLLPINMAIRLVPHSERCGVVLHFREDRARQTTKAFVMPDEVFEFIRPFHIEHFITMSGYEEGLPVEVFKSNDVTSHPTTLSKAGKSNFILPKPKYAHVTYFLMAVAKQQQKAKNSVLFNRQSERLLDARNVRVPSNRHAA